MSVCERAAVIGLGLIGGSVARDLHALGVRVSAYDANAVTLDAAASEGIVDRQLDSACQGVDDADVIVIAVPPDSAIGLLGGLAEQARNAALITDVGSTKARIVEAARSSGLASRFVGSHPMAGDHRSGWPASRVGLFRDARVYLCPSDRSSADARELASAFWHALGGRPTIIEAEEHDKKLAWASHLPHVVASALALAMQQGGITRHDLGPGGRDMTRLAGSSPRLWTAIARENARALDAALEVAEREISGFRAALANETGDEELHRRLSVARQWFDE